MLLFFPPFHKDTHKRQPQRKEIKLVKDQKERKEWKENLQAKNPAGDQRIQTKCE